MIPSKNSKSGRKLIGISLFNWATLLLVIFVLAAWGGSWWWISKNIVSTDPKLLTTEGARGVFGDQFGAVNALFSGLAFTGVIITLLTQQREIKRQSSTLMRQQFESGFFQLLALHTTLVDQLEIGANKGRSAFERFLITMRSRSVQMNVFELIKPLTRTEIGGIAASRSLTELEQKKLGESSPTLAEILKREDGPGLISQYLDQDLAQHLKIIRDAYLSAHIETRDALSHYFRTLYRILRYVDESILVEQEEKNHYAGLVGAQLSGMELAVIFYNAMIAEVELGGQKVEFGYPAMHALIVKYNLTRHLNANVLFHPIHLSVFKNLNARQ